tara:strand:+ start:1576 stop:2973 length:1398 start_codon:yes stop_codon:yes gene_type:complete
MRILFIFFLFIFSCNEKINRPNLVFIIVDDLGWKDVGYMGSDFYETPNIDKLSNMSTVFNSAYSASPVCSPTRASIMTGKHHVRVNITDWIPGVDPKNRYLVGPEDIHQLPLEEVTIAEILESNGYSTMYSGKWHLGSEGFYPEDQGFTINKGGYEKGSPMGGYYSPYKNPRLADGPKDEYLTDRLTDESIEFIEKRDVSKPFAVFLSFYNVHTPIQANLKHIDYYENKLKKNSDITIQTTNEGEAISVLNQRNSLYASMVHSTDENIGRLISFLKQRNLYDNTLIIFTSDNGGLSTQAKVAPTSTKPLRAGKGWLYEGGIRIPQLIKFVNQKNQHLIVDPVVSYDLFITVFNHLKLNHNLDEKDGIDLSNLSSKKIERDYILWHFPHYHGSLWKPGSAIRNGDWKLLKFYEENKLELYNLKNDLGEETDLSSEYPLIVKKLSNKMGEMLIEMDGKLPTINQNLN